MDLIIKLMQLSIDKYTQTPQQEGSLPTRAVVFADISNMFNITGKFDEHYLLGFPGAPRPSPFFCGGPGPVHHRCEDGSWCAIQVLEGVTQG